MRGVGGAPRGLRTHQPSLHGRRTNEFRRAIKTAPTRRASLQRSIARKGSANATIIPPTNARQATTNEKTTHPQPNHRQLNPSRRDENILPTSNSKPTNLNGDDQGDHAIARTGRVTAGGKYRPRTQRYTCGETNYPGDGEKIWMESNKGEYEYPLFKDNKDAKRFKGAYGTTSKGEEHR